jgi:hypothetical protein
MQIRTGNVAEAGAWDISSGVTCPAYSLRSSYGGIFVPTDPSGSGMDIGWRLLIPRGTNTDTASPLAL